MTTYYYLVVREKGRRDKHVHVTTNKKMFKRNKREIRQDYEEVEVVDDGKVEGDMISAHYDGSMPNFDAIR